MHTYQLLRLPAILAVACTGLLLSSCDDPVQDLQQEIQKLAEDNSKLSEEINTRKQEADEIQREVKPLEQEVRQLQDKGCPVWPLVLACILAPWVGYKVIYMLCKRPALQDDKKTEEPTE